MPSWKVKVTLRVNAQVRVRVRVRVRVPVRVRVRVQVPVPVPVPVHQARCCSEGICSRGAGSGRGGTGPRRLAAERGLKPRFYGGGEIIQRMTITIKTAADVVRMRLAGRLASEVLDMLTPHVKPGITTDQLDKLAHDYIVHEQHAIPAPLNYAPAGYTP